MPPDALPDESGLPMPLLAEGAPAPIGPYSPGVVVDGFLFCSGQTPLDPATGQLVGGGIGAQTERALANLDAVLRAAKLSRRHVVRTNVYLTSMAHFAEMNAAYASFFGEWRPARTTVAVAGLPAGADVEIELVARVARG